MLLNVLDSTMYYVGSSPRARFSFSFSLVIGTVQVRVFYNPFCPSPSTTNNVFYVPLAALSRPIRTGHGGISLCKVADKRALCGRALCGRERAGGQGGRLAGRWLQQEQGRSDWRAVGNLSSRLR